MGVLQQSAPPGQFVGFEKTASKPPAVTNEGDSLQLMLYSIYKLLMVSYLISEMIYTEKLKLGLTCISLFVFFVISGPPPLR